MFTGQLGPEFVGVFVSLFRLAIGSPLERSNLAFEKPKRVGRSAFARLLGKVVCAIVLLLAPPTAHAGVPITLYRSFAGPLDYVGAAGTLRVGACGTQASGSGTLAGLPAGSTVRAAYLYWAGSGSTVDSTVTLSTPAASNNTILADRTFTETFANGGTNYEFFAGFTDVTALVASGGNGTYTLSNLAFNTGAPHNAVSACLGGWSLLVIFEDVAEPLRVVNVFDGFRQFRGSQITLIPNNFVIPVSPINGKLGHITWEGDVGNSATLGGFQEQLRFEGTALTDANNPSNNQFNSISNITNPASNLPGVDFDSYDISPMLSAGQTSGTTLYSSGGDLVLLSAEVFSVTNTPVADLSISKVDSGGFGINQVGSWTLTVSSSGPSDDPGPITVTDTLPAGVSYVGASGTGWGCSESGGTVTCTHAAGIVANTALPPVTLDVLVSPSAPASITNTASVAGSIFDNVSGNNSATVMTTVGQPNLLIFKTLTVLDDPANGTSNPKAIPGANVFYSIGVSNQGPGAADAESVLIEDLLPAELDFFVGDYITPGPVHFIDGATPSQVTVDFTSLADDLDDLEFDDGSNTWVLDPVADAQGFDSSVRAIRIRPTGTMAGATGTPPSFEVRFRARIK